MQRFVEHFAAAGDVVIFDLVAKSRITTLLQGRQLREERLRAV
jgi:hypothetical protein